MATFDDLPSEIKSLVFKERYDMMKNEFKLKKYKKNYDICVLELQSVFECFNDEEGYVDIQYEDEHIENNIFQIINYETMRNIYPLHYYYLTNEAYLYDCDDIGKKLLKIYNEKYKPKLTVLLCTNGEILPFNKVSTKYDILAV